jgi:hypothetical protein
MLNRGVPVPVRAALCNQIGAHPWDSIPLMLNDAAVEAIAQQWLATLDPDKIIYVELSNEVWNFQFWQTAHALQKGRDMGFTAHENHWFYAHRSIEVFKIFESVFGGLSRIRRVLSTQSVVSYVGERILEYNHPVHGLAKNNCDIFAAALYYAGSHQWMNKPWNAELLLSMSLDQILDWMYDDVTIARYEGPGGIHDPDEAQPSCRMTIQNHAQLCAQHGLKPAMYEGNGHLQSNQMPAQHQAQLTALFGTLNRHPRMKEINHAWLKTLDAYDIEPAQFFSFAASIWDKFGQWSVLEHQFQTVQQSPKLQSIHDFMG